MANTIPLLSTWEAKQAIGEPVAVIRVQNLQAFLDVGDDAWGRSGILKPVLLSAVVTLREAFRLASANDAVNKSTVHYGILSKKIIEASGIYQQVRDSTSEPRDLKHVLDRISSFLTQYTLDGTKVTGLGTAILSPETIKSLELEVTLPKASLNGKGISFRGIAVYSENEPSPNAYAMTLKIKELYIPCLIGVNSVERNAKQMVIANVELDRCVGPNIEYYKIEELVVKESRMI